MIFVLQVAFSCEPIGIEKGFVILNSQYYCGELHCLLLHVDEQEIEESKGKKSRFVSVIDWITLEGGYLKFLSFKAFLICSVTLEVCLFLSRRSMPTELEFEDSSSAGWRRKHRSCCS